MENSLENASPTQDNFAPSATPLADNSNPSSKTLPLVVGGLLLLTAVAIGAYYLGMQNVQNNNPLVPVTPTVTPSTAPENPEEGVMCTMDAKLCPDGSAVGRTGPNCEFSPCPGEASEKEDPTKNWETYTDETYTFKYPPTWKTEAGAQTSEEYFGGDTVLIKAPNSNVSIDITAGPQVFGFGEDSMSHQRGETITVKINGNTFSGTETIIPTPPKSVFVIMTVPVGDKEFDILFGTGSPITDENHISYDDYLKYKSTIVDILSTLTITP